MINALGLLEVSGLTAGIEAADAMLKAAQVRLLSQAITNPGMVTLVVEGDLAACRAALDAGTAAANRLGHVVARKDIGRPDKDTEWMILSLTKYADNTPPKSNKVAVKKTVIKQSKSEQTSTPPQEVEVETTITKQAPSPSKTKPLDTTLSEDTLLDFVASQPEQGRNITEIIAHFKATRGEVKAKLTQCISSGTLRKRGNRYYLEVKK